MTSSSPRFARAASLLPARERRASFELVAREWLDGQRALVEVGELAPRTLDGYELSVRCHLVPFFGSRPIATITANDLVAWHAAQRGSGAAHDGP